MKIESLANPLPGQKATKDGWFHLCHDPDVNLPINRM
jgi:hypothetical protein